MKVRNPFFDATDSRHSSMRRNTWICLWNAILLGWAAVIIPVMFPILGQAAGNIARDLVTIFLVVAFPSQLVQKALEMSASAPLPPPKNSIDDLPLKY